MHTCLMLNYTYLPIRTQFINQNSYYQPFSVKVGFLPQLDFPTEDIFINKPIPRVRSSSYRGGVILIDLNQSSPDTNCFRYRVCELDRNTGYVYATGTLVTGILTLWDHRVLLFNEITCYWQSSGAYYTGILYIFEGKCQLTDPQKRKGNVFLQNEKGENNLNNKQHNCNHLGH